MFCLGMRTRVFSFYFTAYLELNYKYFFFVKFILLQNIKILGEAYLGLPQHLGLEHFWGLVKGV